MRIGGTDVLTLTQAAAETGLSANTLRAQIRNGVLPATLIGKTYVVTADDLARYVETHKGRHGVASPSHPLYGKRGGGGRRKKAADGGDSGGAGQDNATEHLKTQPRGTSARQR